MEWNYLIEKKRMLEAFGCMTEYSHCGKCKNCPFYRHDGIQENCVDFEIAHPEEATSIVRKWSEENPRTTMLEKFKELFPKAELDTDRTPYRVCPWDLGWTRDSPINCQTNCVDCWNRPYAE